VLSVMDTVKEELKIVPCPGFMMGAATVTECELAKLAVYPHPHSTKTKRLGITNAGQR
jgi:hypothetical protein